MSDIADTELRRLDMGLLLVFAETMRHRKLTRVAEQLGQTQSSISHALGRLRDIFGDPLFVRRPNGVEPTERAIALEPRIADILDLTRSALSKATTFDPASASDTVRIAAQDYHCALFAAPLAAACAARAPGLRMSFRPLARTAASAVMAAAEVDLVIGFNPRADARFMVQLLVEQGYAVVARHGHPRVATDLTLPAYLRERHLLVSYRGDARGIVDTLLAQRGLSREVVMTLPYYLPALAAVAGSDLIATVPQRLAEAHGTQFGLQVIEPPLTIRRFAISVVRHRRHATSTLLDWVVEKMADPAVPTTA
jgi:DNA-binding transcriptional LysR family regulator